MASIFELSAEAANLKDAMEQDLQGEELDNLIVLKSENEEDFKQKVLSYGKLILILEAEIESLKTEVSRLNGRVKIRESLITRLKDALNFSMDQASQKKIENEFVTV